jgi:GNAT superfamily N-acetyltransferase
LSHLIIRRRPEHDPEIFALYAEAFGEDRLERSRARWQWQFADNPNNGDDGPVIWLAVEDNRVLGQMATMPFPMWWGDREVHASAGMDCFVRKDAQGRGLGVELSQVWADHVDVALGLGLTPASHPMLRKTFTDVGPVPAYVRPLDAAAVARRRWGRVAGSAAGPVLDLGLRLFSRRIAPAAGIEVRDVAAVTEEYTDLWERARRSFATAVRRDARYLAWKYLACPFRAYRFLEARTHGALSGYLVWRPEGDPSFPRGVIVDLFCDTGDAAVQDALIDAAVEAFRQQRFARAETYSMCAAFGRAFQRHGFWTGRTAIQYCVAHRRVSREPLSRTDAWHLMLGDGDLDRA